MSDPRPRATDGDHKSHNDTSNATPDAYGNAAPAYLDRGYVPLPLLDSGKGTTPKGATGYDAVVNAATVSIWVKRYADRGLCLLLAGLVGLDVDAYDGKPGAASLAALEAEYGELPPTVRISSRLDAEDYDGHSGIRLFRLPVDALPLEARAVWRSGPGPGIDLVRRAHRQVNAWPAVHASTGRTYRFLDEGSGVVVLGPLPPVKALPELPAAWLPALLREGLSPEGALREGEAVSAGRADVPASWLTEGSPCRPVLRALERAMSELNGPTASRHDSTRDRLLGILRLGEQGHRGVAAALDTLEGRFLDTVGADRPAEASSEWQRMAEGGAAKVAGDGLTPEANRGCCPGVESAQEAFGAGGFFDATDTLRRVKLAAHARGVSAVANLGYVLARVLAEVPPSVTLPPVIGGPAPLNLGVLIVGGSAAGKSSTLDTSRATLGLVGQEQHAIERPLGSGEGIAEAFLQDEVAANATTGGTRKTGRKVLIDDPRRILLADEVDQVAATQGRNGSTLAPVLRTGISGGVLGQQNASADRNRNVRAGSYRLVVFMGVQPTRSGVLLQDADAGTPQRFLWLPAKDTSSPASAEEWPDWPGALNWTLPAEMPEQIDYPQHVKNAIRQARADYHHSGEGFDELAGHVRLTRLKVAAALALLHGEVAISDQWWELAGQLTDLSQAEQQECLRVLGSARQKLHDSAAVVAARSDEAVDEDKAKRAAKSVLGKVRAAEGEWVTKHHARPPLALREYVDEAIDALITAGQIEVQEYEHNGAPAKRLRYVGA